MRSLRGSYAPERATFGTNVAFADAFPDIRHECRLGATALVAALGRERGGGPLGV